MISSYGPEGSSYRVCRPSRFKTARPPSWLMARANFTSTVPSMALATKGILSFTGPMAVSVLVSSGSTVTEPGTMATSSNP